MCLYAAADLRRRRTLVILVAVVHLYSVVAMLMVRLLGDVSGFFAGTDVPLSTVLWGASALDGVIFLLLLIFLAAAGKTAPDPGIYALDDREPMTAAERRLRAFASVFGLLCIAVAAFMVALAARGVWPELMGVLPQVTNTTVVLVAAGLVSLHATVNLRRRQALLGLVVQSLSIGTLVLLGYWFVGADGQEAVSFAGASWAVPDLLLLAAAPAGAACLVLFTLYQAAWRSRYQLKYLEPMEFRTLLGLAEVLIEGDDEVLSPLEVAKNVDATIFSIGAKRRWIYRAILFIVYLHPLLYDVAGADGLAGGAALGHPARGVYQRRGLRGGGGAGPRLGQTCPTDLDRTDQSVRGRLLPDRDL